MSLEDLQPGIPLPKRPTPPAPLLPLALGMMLGIVADSLLALPVWVWALLVAAGAFGIALRRWPRGLLGGRLHTFVAQASRLPMIPRRLTRAGQARRLNDARAGQDRRLNGTWIGFVALMVAAAGLGSFRHAIADRCLPDNHVVFFTDDKPILAQLRGRILTPPRVAEPQAGVPRAYPTGPKTRFVLEATHVAGLDHFIPVTGKVAVVVKEPLLSLHIGDSVQLTGWFYRPIGPRNPGAYDWARHQRRNGLLAGLSCDHAESVIVQGKARSGGWQGILHTLRSRLRGYLLEDAFAGDDEAAGIIAAMILGQRSAVPKAMNEAFIKTGNAHFLAASGMHVAWLALVGWGVARLLGLYYRTATLLVGLLILSYVLLAEPRPSILRAGIIGLLACTTVYLRGRYNALNSLSLAAIVILTLAPADLFRPAFQYSFMAVLALLHLCPHVAKTIASWLMKANLPGVARSFDRALYGATLAASDAKPRSLFAGFKRGASFGLAQLLALAISAWFITSPLSCYHFNVFTPMGWFQTLLLWFIALPVTCFGFITLLLGVLFPSSGAICGPILKMGTDLMIAVVQLLARIPGTLLEGRSPSIGWLLAVYAALWMWVYKRHWLPWRHAFKLLAIVLTLWWAVPPRWLHAESDTLKVWTLAVGNGCGTVIELPNGRVWIYDFGTRSSFDAGAVGEAFLDTRGIQRIDTVFVSHANFDHFSGVETLAEQFKIGRVVINDQYERFALEGSSARRFLDKMKQLDIPIEVTHGSHRIGNTGDVRAEVIWPPAADRRMTPDANEASTVLRLSYEGKTILLTGDIAEMGMASLMADTHVQADALLLPHHGGVTHLTGAFLDTVDPQVAVRSSGQRRELTTNNIETLVGDRQYFNTADHGCILLEIKKGQLTVRAVMSDD